MILVKDLTTDCMKPKTNLIDKKYDRLTVIAEAPSIRNPNGKSVVMWKCKCDCGNIIITRHNSLYTKRTKSCGCLKKEHCTSRGKKIAKDPKVVGIKSLYRMCKTQAGYRNIEFNLTKEQYENFLFLPCYYCGESEKSTWKRYNQVLNYNGIDRIDSNLGYSIDNCVTCCKHCNTAKMNLTQSQFFDIIKKIYERHLNEST